MTLNSPPPNIDGDEFHALFDAHRRELHVHCYRMTGSFSDAEDLTQEVFLRAWRNLDTFEGRSSKRTWLYRIATNICLDFLKSHQRRAHPTDTIAETLEHDAMIEPYPDRLDPADQVASVESTDLYLTAALRHLPPRQRVVVIARDLLDFDAATTATVLDSTSTAVNSLLQRAHEHLRHLNTDLDHLVHPPADEHAHVVRAYIDAHHRGDVDAIVQLLYADVRISMPPEPPSIGARDARRFFAHLFSADGPGDWHLEPVRANGAPALANYVRPPGGTTFRALSIDVLRIDRDRIAAINCFLGTTNFPIFGLPLDLDPTRPSESDPALTGMPPRGPDRPVGDDR